MKKKSGVKKVILIVLIVLVVLFLLLLLLGSDDSTDSETSSAASEQTESASGEEYASGSTEETYEESADAGSLRERYVDTSDAGNTVILLYMIGSNLESVDGSATDDLDEMKEAHFGDNLKIVAETGGSDTWYTDGMEAGVNQRWCIDDEGMQLVDTDSEGSMTDKSRLAGFLKWGVQTYPADRYILILWDHGGGTMAGFGQDEIYDSGSLSIADMADAMKSAGTKFDIIGFDACLMATVETAYAFEPYADYLIASEETEPGNGWAYTDFLNELADDPAIDSVELGKKIIDDYGDFYDNTNVTLSITDLREIPNVYEKVSAYLESAEATIKKDNDQFAEMSMARSKARAYADGAMDQIDMEDLVNRTEFDGKDEIMAAIDSCVKYHNKSSLKGSNGLAMYFPYSDIDSYSYTQDILDDIGYSEPTQFYDYFLSVMAGGQELFQSDNSMMHENETNYTDEDWYQNYAGDFDYGDGYGELTLNETDDGYVLDLADDVWDLITDIRISVMMKMEDGFIDMGSDNVGSMTDDGKLLVDFDGEWISIDDTPVAFNAYPIYDEGKGNVFSGSVEATLNGKKDIELYLEWDPLADDAPEDAEQKGHVLGYNLVHENNDTEEKGLRQLKKGDKISFKYDCYDTDGNFLDTMEPFDPITVTSQDALEVGYADISDMDAYYWATLTDIYQQDIETEAIEYTAGK